MSRHTAEEIASLPLGVGFHTALRKALDSNLSSIAWIAAGGLDEGWKSFLDKVQAELTIDLRFDAGSLRSAALTWAERTDHDIPERERTLVSIFACALKDLSMQDWVDITQFIRECDGKFADERRNDELSLVHATYAQRGVYEIRSGEGDVLARISESNARSIDAEKPTGLRLAVVGGVDNELHATFEAARDAALSGVKAARAAAARLEVEPGAADAHRAGRIVGSLEEASPFDKALAAEIGHDVQVLMRKAVRNGRGRSVTYYVLRHGEDGSALSGWDVSDQGDRCRVREKFGDTVEKVLAKLAADGKATLLTTIDEDRTFGVLRFAKHDPHVVVTSEIHQFERGNILVSDVTTTPAITVPAIEAAAAPSI